MTNPVGEDLRCSVWTRGLDPDPVGSAPRFDRLVLVEMPLPWPHDVSEMPALASVPSSSTTRVMAVVPDVDRGGEVLVTVYRRRPGRGGYEGWDAAVAVASLPDFLTEYAGSDDPVPPADATPAPAEFLVCSHGTRDRCCGSFGTRLYGEVTAWPRPELRVRRCSHTGGHRFAPTGMSLPDGRLWAYLDVAVFETIVARSGPTGAVVRHYRGTPLLEEPHQVLERAAFDRFGWDMLDWPIVSATSAAGRHALELGGPAGVVRVSAEVVEARRIPVLTCGSPPEAALKTSVEYSARDLVVDVP